MEKGEGYHRISGHNQCTVESVSPSSHLAGTAARLTCCRKGVEDTCLASHRDRERERGGGGEEGDGAEYLQEG